MQIEISFAEAGRGLMLFAVAYFFLWFEARFVGLLDRARHKRLRAARAYERRKQLEAEHARLQAQLSLQLSQERQQAELEDIAHRPARPKRRVRIQTPEQEQEEDEYVEA